MSAVALTSRAIIGWFYNRLSQSVGAMWISRISMLMSSDQESETYNWLGQVPQMREWIGGRHAKGFTTNGITIKNLIFEATIEFSKRVLRLDKSGQVQVRINELADRTNSHWAKLLSTLIVNGASTVCYDGQFFFDTDHSEGDSGTQSNDLSIDISALPVTNHGSTTAPSADEFAECAFQAISQIQSFVDDQGEPMNEDAMEFIIMVPSSLQKAAVGAVTRAVFAGGGENALMGAGFKLEVAVNPRLNSSFTEQFVVFRADGQTKPFIRQEEQEVELAVKGEGSEFEFDNNAHQYGVSANRNVGYGMWQHACLVTMT